MTALQQAMADAQRKLDAASKPEAFTTERERLWNVLHKHPEGLTIKELVNKFKFSEKLIRSSLGPMESRGQISVKDERAQINNKAYIIKRLFALGDAYVKPPLGRKVGQKYPRKPRSAPGTPFATGAASVPASARPGLCLHDVNSMTVAQLQQMAENGRKAQAILADAAKLYEALGKILNG